MSGERRRRRRKVNLIGFTFLPLHNSHATAAAAAASSFVQVGGRETGSGNDEADPATSSTATAAATTAGATSSSPATTTAAAAALGEQWRGEWSRQRHRSQGTTNTGHAGGILQHYEVLRASATGAEWGSTAAAAAAASSARVQYGRLEQSLARGIVDDLLRRSANNG